MIQDMSTIHAKYSPQYRLLQMTVWILNMLPYRFAVIVGVNCFSGLTAILNDIFPDILNTVRECILKYPNNK